MHTFLTVIAGFVGAFALTILFLRDSIALRLYERRLKTRGVRQYFIRGLNSQRREILSRASIPFSTHALDPEEGALFDRVFLPNVMRLLDASPLLAFSLHDNDIHELVVHCRPHSRQRRLASYSVDIRGTLDRRDLKKLHRFVLETLAIPLETDVVVHLDEGVAVSTNEDTRLHVFLGARTGVAKAQKSVRRLCGIPHKDMLPTVPQVGFGFYDRTAGVVFGELTGPSLHIYPEVVRGRRPKPNFALMQKLFEKIVDDVSTESYAEHVTEYFSSAGLETASNTEVVIGAGLTEKQGRVLAVVAKAALGHAVNRTILVAHGRGNPIEPPDESKFGVFVYSSPHASSLVQPCRQLYGVSGLSQSHRLAPSAAGLILTDDKQNVVAELLPNALYIYQNVLTVVTAPELAVLTAILEQAAKSIEKMPNKDEWLRTEFEDTCLRLLSPSAAQMDSSLSVSLARQNYHSAMAHLSQSERAVHGLKGSDERYGEEFDALRNNSKVVDVRLRGDEMIVTTDTLYCINPATKIKHEIGEMEIHLSLHSGGVQWINLTRRIRNHHAPHVGPDRACLGNMSGVFGQLILGGQLVAAVDAAICFVESVNPNDPWGKRIVDWPRA